MVLLELLAEHLVAIDSLKQRALANPHSASHFHPFHYRWSYDDLVLRFLKGFRLKIYFCRAPVCGFGHLFSVLAVHPYPPSLDIPE